MTPLPQPPPRPTAPEGTTVAHPTSEIPAALAALDGLDRRPTAEHVPAFEQLHTVLTDALSAIDGV